MFLKTYESNNPRFRKYSTKVSRTLGSTLGSIRASRTSGRQRPRLPPPPPPQTGSSFPAKPPNQNSNQPCKYKVYGSTPVTSTVTSPGRNTSSNFGIPIAGSMSHHRQAPPPPQRFGSLQRGSGAPKRAAPPVPDLAPVTEVITRSDWSIFKFLLSWRKTTQSNS